MEFLGERNIYHGDLAARNILLTDELVAKVADFGLSRRLYQSAYSSLGDGMRLPMKWLALESLVHGKASLKCDIWSYGVLVWEIFELGGEPYRRGKYDYLRNKYSVRYYAQGLLDFLYYFLLLIYIYIYSKHSLLCSGRFFVRSCKTT